jgi:hypothetical protein
MFDRFYHKGATFLTKLLLGEGRPPKLRTGAEMRSQMERYRLRKPAILWDGKVAIADILDLVFPDADNEPPVYTFSLDACLDPAARPSPRLLEAGPGPSSADGWIVASGNPLDQASLAGFLSEQGLSDRVILNQSVFSGTTSYYSYIDYLGGDHRTLIHIHNPIRRCYGYPFPLAIRLTLRDASGSILDVTQSLLAPDCGVTLTKDSFRVSPERGYVEAEFELHRKVNPFLHYLADYSNEAHVFTNHQSGLGLHPARSRFTRGYLPSNPRDELEVCLFQRDYSNPPPIRITLRYRQADRERALQTEIGNLARGEIRWLGVRSLFPDVDPASLGNAILEVESDVPLHRPNYYYRSGVTGLYHDVSHAGADLRMQVASVYGGQPTVTSREKEALREHGVDAFDLRFFLPPEEFGVDSIAGMGNDTTAEITDFQARYYSADGVLRDSFPVHFPVPNEFQDLDAMVRARFPRKGGGVLSLVPARAADPVPIVMNGISGFRRSGGGPLTTTAASGSQPDNLPLYFRGGPPCYTGSLSTYGVTEIFARGIRSAEFDTLFMLSYPKSSKGAARRAAVEIQILSRGGSRYCHHADIAPNGSLFLRLSEMLKKFPEADGEEYFTIWFLASGAHMYGQHLLIRTSDGSISLEHCYVGKFGF